jgi:acyl carrier protein
MTDPEIRRAVLELLCNIAPEADPAALRPDVNYREQLDIDSMDLLNFLISLHKHFGVEIPERDYPQLMTLDHCVAYVAAALARKSP